MWLKWTTTLFIYFFFILFVIFIVFYIRKDKFYILFFMNIKKVKNILMYVYNSIYIFFNNFLQNIYRYKVQIILEKYTKNDQM